MRFVRYLFALWAALLVYSVFSFFGGHNGLLVRRQLEAERDRLLANWSALEAVNRSYLRAKEGLLHDDDALSVYARQLGFGHSGEEFVRLMGLNVAASVELPPGQALYAAPPDHTAHLTIRVAALIVGGALLLSFLFQDIYWLRHKDDG